MTKSENLLRVAVGAVLMVLLGFLVIVLARLPGRPAQASPESVGYRFEVTGVKNPRETGTEKVLANRARVSFLPKWSTNGFPGTRVCTYVVYGEEGETIGEVSSHFTALESASSGGSMHVDVPVDPTKSPVGASVECRGERLDDPGGHYGIEVIGVESPSVSKGYDLDVLFDYDWIGDGSPTPQRCDITVWDAEGQELFAGHTNFFGAGEEPRRSASMGVKAPNPEESYLAEVDSATVRCVPME